MITIENKSDCCGCNACTSACPVQCIVLRDDNEGFGYPNVDKERCINCSLCEKVCPTRVQRMLSLDKKPKTYAMVNKNDKVRWESSSGGVFSLLAEEVLKKEGIVVGAILSDDNKSVYHIAIEDIVDLYRIRGSKYVQSEIGDCYIHIKRYLEENRNVLFTGTPCQVAGLKSFLGREYDRLFCMDFVCHGVPSKMVWKKYVSFREKSAGGKVNHVHFRNKEIGWKNFSILFEFSNLESYSEVFSKDLFMQTFLNNISLRPSCYNCKFKTKEHLSDVTVGDLWGVQHILPEMDDDKGVSVVMIHSKNGGTAIESILAKTRYKEIEYESILKYNSAMIKSVKRNKNRDKFFEKMDVWDFDILVKKYATSHVDLKQNLKKMLKKVGIWNIVRRIVLK